MTIDEWKESKKKLGLTEEQMAKLSGVPVDIVKEIFSGRRIPDFETWIALEEALQEPKDMVREEKAPYLAKKKEKYTVEDYYAIPGGTRVELFEGEIYNMGAPSLMHQAISLEIARKIGDFIDKNRGKCVPFIAPVDVQLNCDEFTMLQPDLIVVCDRDKMKNKRCILGAPDLVMEILSPSNKINDMTWKLMAYMNAGVREYWMINPEKRTIVVYNFAQSGIPKIYGFDSKVPVAIFDDQCEVNFTEIYRSIRFLYDD